MLEAETATVLHDLLHNLGYKAEMIDENAVGSAAAGLKFYIQAYSMSIQFRCVLGIDSETGSMLEFANAFNREMRFIKIYLDEAGDLLAETDWWFDAEDSNHATNFRTAVDFWELSLAAVKEKLREHSRLVSTQITKPE